MFAHILKQMVRQWRSNLWISVELLLVFACMNLCVHLVVTQASCYIKGIGMDIDHVYLVSLDYKSENTPGHDATRNDKEDLLELLDRLRRYDGVEGVGLLSEHVRPYTASGSSGYFKHDSVGILRRSGIISPECIDVLRMRSMNGDINLRQEAEKGCVLMYGKDMEKLFGHPVERAFSTLGDKKHPEGYTCVATTWTTICEYMNDDATVYFCKPEEKMAKRYDFNILVRVRPEADHHFAQRFFDTLGAKTVVGNYAITDMDSMQSVRQHFLNITSMELTNNTVIGLSAFFILCTLLGIIGTFWFRTEARKAEIGLRMAIGATRSSVQRQLLLEGWMLLAVVWLPGLLLAWQMRFGLTLDYGEALELSETAYFAVIAVLATLVMLLLIGLGTWYPAWRASRTSPTEALRNE